MSDIAIRENDLSKSEEELTCNQHNESSFCLTHAEWLVERTDWRCIPILPFAFGTLQIVIEKGLSQDVARLNSRKPSRDMNIIEFPPNLENVSSPAVLEKAL